MPYGKLSFQNFFEGEGSKVFFEGRFFFILLCTVEMQLIFIIFSDIYLKFVNILINDKCLSIGEYCNIKTLVNA